jgi:hypothetical protein
MIIAVAGPAMSMVPTPPAAASRDVVVGAPPWFRNLGQFDAACGLKVAKVHPSID